MINTTDFLDALRNFEYVAKQKDLPKSLKTQVKKHLLNELNRLVANICDAGLGNEIDEMEIFKGTNEALKNL